MAALNEIPKTLVDSISKVLIGKEDQVTNVIVSLLARGHVLIEDIPGVGKTLLGLATARSMGARFRRIQFTSDTLPSDVIGVNVYDPNKADFDFKEGPVFTEVLLADEINRTSPRTQSALLEAMAEGTCVVAANRGSLPECLGDGAVMLDGLHPHEVAETVFQLLHDRDLREAYGRKGREQAAKYSWESSGRKTLHIYRDMI